MAVSVKKNFVPDPTTPFPGGWEQSLNSVGSIVREENVGAARSRLSLAEAQGVGASVGNPWYFQILGNLYFSEGAKNSSGEWILTPVNQIEAVEQPYSDGGTKTLTGRGYVNVITSALGPKPYDRLVVAHGSVYGRVTSGIANGRLYVNATDFVDARFPTGSSDHSNAALTNSGIIRADVVPEIRLGVAGDLPGTGKSTVALAVNPSLNRLVVTAFPVAMG